MMVSKVIVPANLRNKQSVALHRGIGFLRETAGIGICACLTDPAAAAAQTQGMGILRLDYFCQQVKLL